MITPLELNAMADNLPVCSKCRTALKEAAARIVELELGVEQVREDGDRRIEELETRLAEWE